MTETVKNTKTDIRAIVEIALMTALLAVCSWISIPFAVPFTLQTFGVFFAMKYLGGKKGTLAVVIYILLGMIGVPVFAGFSGGAAVILGPTGGYIVGFIAMGLIYWLMEKQMKKKFVSYLVLAFGLLMCYLIGTVWFVVVYTKNSGPVGIIQALSWCVFPFIIPDAVKLCLAVFVSGKVKKAMDKVL